MCGEFGCDEAGEKPSAGREGAGASVTFLLKNSKEFLFSNEVDLILLTLFCRDIV